MGCGNNSILGNNNGYIKYQGGNLVAIQGVNVLEKLNLSNVVIPYKQIFKGSFILKPGQVNYLMNHFGLGDNATLVAMTATYDVKSRFEEDNFVQYHFSTNKHKQYAFAQVVTLTGNSKNRIPHMYLSNPNEKYPVIIDVMVASIDDTYSFFPDYDTNSTTSFDDVSYEDIKTFTPGKTIYIKDKTTDDVRVYISLTNMESIVRAESILIVKDPVIGKIYLDFGDEFSALQGLSLIEWSRHNELDIDSLDTLIDMDPPYVLFKPQTVYKGGTNVYAVSTNDADYYEINLPIYNAAPIYKEALHNIIFDANFYAIDNRDGQVIYSIDEVRLFNSSDMELTYINNIGVYTMRLKISDIAGNTMFDRDIKMNITNYVP